MAEISTVARPYAEAVFRSALDKGALAQVAEGLALAAAIARDVSGVAAGVKLGLEFFCANGDEGVLRIAEHQTPIFLDLTNRRLVERGYGQ